MGIVTAKKRFVAGNPVKAGVNYKHTINGKQYIFQAKYDKTLSEFNSMWFLNLTPKEYFMSTLAFNASDVVLPQDDTIIVNGIRYLNSQSGTLSRVELEVLFNQYKEERLVAGILINGEEDHRTKKINIRPFQNKNSEELKYFGMNDFTRTVGVTVLEINKEVDILFEVTEVFVPVRVSSVIVHKVVVSFTGFTASYSGTSPTSTTATSATYTLPNSLTVRRLTIVPDGTSLTLIYS